MSSSLDTLPYLQKSFRAEGTTFYKLKVPEPFYCYVKCKKTIKTIIRREVPNGESVFNLFGRIPLWTVTHTKTVEDIDIKKLYTIELPNASIERFVEKLIRDLDDCAKPILHKGRYIGEVSAKEETGTVSFRVAPKIVETEDTIKILWVRV